jgi:hypothetical protein
MTRAARRAAERRAHKVLYLRRGLGMGTEEIAEAMRLRSQTVKKILRDAGVESRGDESRERNMSMEVSVEQVEQLREGIRELGEMNARLRPPPAGFTQGDIESLAQEHGLSYKEALIELEGFAAPRHVTDPEAGDRAVFGFTSAEAQARAKAGGISLSEAANELAAERRPPEVRPSEVRLSEEKPKSPSIDLDFSTEDVKAHAARTGLSFREAANALAQGLAKRR